MVNLEAPIGRIIPKRFKACADCVIVRDYLTTIQDDNLVRLMEIVDIFEGKARVEVTCPDHSDTEVYMSADLTDGRNSASLDPQGIVRCPGK